MSDIVHRFQSAKSDPADTTLVRPSNWNDSHKFDPAIVGLVKSDINSELSAVMVNGLLKDDGAGNITGVNVNGVMFMSGGNVTGFTVPDGALYGNGFGAMLGQNNPGLIHSLGGGNVVALMPPRGFLYTDGANSYGVYNPTGVYYNDGVNPGVSGAVASAAGQYLRRARNVAGVVYAFQNAPEIISTDYNFSSPISTNLVGGSPGSVVFTVLPDGVNATYSPNRHYLHISDAVGGEEDVLITGVVGTTIFFTPTLSHLVVNATIASATSGIQEAVFAATSDIGIRIPTGNYNIYKRIFSSREVKIRGGGQYSTVLYGLTLNTPVIECIYASGLQRCTITDLAILPSGGPFTTTGVIHVQGYTNGLIQNIYLQNVYIGIDWYMPSGGGNPSVMNNIYIAGCQSGGTGIRYRSASTGQVAGLINNFYHDGVGSVALSITGTAAGFTITNMWTQFIAYGILLDASTRQVNEIVISNSIIDGPTVAGIYIKGPATNGVTIGNVLIQHDVNSYGVLIEAISRVSLNGVRINSVSTNPAIILNTCQNVTVSSCVLYAATGASAGFLMRLIGANDSISILGNTFVSEVGAYTGISLSAEAHVNIRISGNTANGNITTPISNGSTSALVIQKGNLWATAPPSVASATTIAIPSSLDVGDVFLITGTTTITGITGGYAGARYLIRTAGIVAMNTGVASPTGIETSITSVAGGVYNLVYNSTLGKWMIF